MRQVQLSLKRLNTAGAPHNSRYDSWGRLLGASWTTWSLTSCRTPLLACCVLLDVRKLLRECRYLGDPPAE